LGGVQDQYRLGYPPGHDGLYSPPPGRAPRRLRPPRLPQARPRGRARNGAAQDQARAGLFRKSLIVTRPLIAKEVFMPIRIGINGFGRIGRYLIRLAAAAPDIELAAVNARADNAALAHMLKYDSVHGRFPFPVSATDKGLNVDGRDVPVTRKPTGEW